MKPDNYPTEEEVVDTLENMATVLKLLIWDMVGAMALAHHTLVPQNNALEPPPDVFDWAKIVGSWPLPEDIRRNLRESPLATLWEILVDQMLHM